MDNRDCVDRLRAFAGEQLAIATGQEKLLLRGFRTVSVQQPSVHRERASILNRAADEIEALRALTSQGNSATTSADDT